MDITSSHRPPSRTQSLARFNQTRLGRTPWLVVLAAGFNLTLVTGGTAVLVWGAANLTAGCERTPDTRAGYDTPRETNRNTAAARAAMPASVEGPERTPVGLTQ